MSLDAERTVEALVEVVRTMIEPRVGAAALVEARDLVAAVLGEPRFWPSLHGAEMVEHQVVEAVCSAARRRAKGAPFAYAVRQAAFRYLTLGVDQRVLIPRQETEVLVDLILAAPQHVPGATAADVGTGSGAIALALATEGKFGRVIATDISTDALAVAATNVQRLCARLTARVELRAGDALRPLIGTSVDVLVSNPPYIAFAEAPELPALVRDWEPPQALVCPEDGLAVTRAIVQQARAIVRPGGLLAFEVDSRRAHRVAEMVQATGAFDQTEVHPDLTGRDRFVLATRNTR
ncbi:MAG: peptide chain release factor N(5)-glutamine methyltransferase [Gemmatimonadaceae bacterium]